MEEHNCLFEFKARFYTLGQLSSETKEIWFVLHGYGQLARYFIEKFDALKTAGIYVVAPEGLSRFYLENPKPTGRLHDRVGATWMTKENRQVDIENYLHLLNTVYHQIINADQVGIPVTVLGFSQGAATASRWVASQRIRFTRLILWSGVFPPDMDFTEAKQALEDKLIYFIYGKSDPYITRDRLVDMNALCEKLTISPTVIAFDGTHEMDKDTLKSLL